MVEIAQEKIRRFSPERYLILSSLEVKKEDEVDINRMIDETLNSYQCQIIVNGVLPTIKYYLQQNSIKPATRRVAGRSPATGFIF